MSLCSLAYLKNHMSELHQHFCACSQCHGSIFL